jgi:hypothetical protein
MFAYSIRLVFSLFLSLCSRLTCLISTSFYILENALTVFLFCRFAYSIRLAFSHSYHFCSRLTKVPLSKKKIIKTIRFRISVFRFFFRSFLFKHQLNNSHFSKCYSKTCVLVKIHNVTKNARRRRFVRGMR